VKLSIVVPFYNELRTLPTVIQRLLAVDFASLGVETEILFVDDGSTDASRALLDPLPREDCRLLVHKTNRGKGAAVKTGLEAATGDLLCIQDADLEYHPDDLPALVEPIIAGEYDVVYGNRFKGSAAGLYYSHRLANRMLNTTVNVLFNRYLSDVYTGYKVFTRSAFDGLSLTARSFTVEMELTAHFLRKGLVIYEVPISYRARTYAEGKKIHFKDGFLAAGAAVRYRFAPAGDVAKGPLDRRAPDAPGALDSVEGDLGSIHARGLEDLVEAGAYRRYIAEHVRPWCGSSVLQVKAGLGDLTEHLAAAPASRRVVAVDDDPLCVRALEDRFARAPNVEVALLDLDQELKVAPPVGTVLAVNVLEYVADDVTAVRRMAAAAEPGGTLVLIVAGYPSLAGAYEQALRQRRYTPASLRGTVEEAGLDVVELRPINLLGGLAWWLAVRVAGIARPTPGLVRLYDRLVVPAERVIERRLEPPFGQSLVCVARVRRSPTV
jgi:SAM-dependent methyltransferase